MGWIDHESLAQAREEVFGTTVPHAIPPPIPEDTVLLMDSKGELHTTLACPELISTSACYLPGDWEGLSRQQIQQLGGQRMCELCNDDMPRESRTAASTAAVADSVTATLRDLIRKGEIG